MNTKEYNYSYANRIGNALTEPFYKLYKADTKYLETLDSKVRNVAEHIFDTANILLLNIIAIPLSLPLWFLGKAIIQYTSPKFNYSSMPSDATRIKADLLAMVKDHKEETISKVFSHGAWVSLYDYRIEPNREFGAIPGLESVRKTESTLEKIHSFLEQKMIFIKLSDSNRLIETIQKNLNAKASDEMSESIATDSPEIEEQTFSLNDFNKSYIFNVKLLRDQNPDASFEGLMDIMRKAKTKEMFGDNLEEPAIKDCSTLVKHPQNQKSFSNYDYSNYLVELVSKDHKLPLEEAINFVAKNFYSGNNITYQGVNCLLRGIGVLS